MKNSKKRKYCILAGILILALVLNLYKIQDQGIFDEDGLLYYTAARTDIAAAKWVLSGKSYSFHDYLEENRIHARSNYYGKPFYHALSMSSLLLFGDHDYSLQIMNAIFAVGTAFVIFKIGTLLYGINAGLYACLFCVLSPLFLWLGRTSLPHMPQFFFFFMGMYYYLKSVRCESEREADQPLFAAGIFMALSILTHPSAIAFAGIFVLFELYDLIRKRNGRRFVWRAVIMVLPFLVFAFLTNAALNAARSAIGPEGLKEYIGSGGIYMNYIEQFLYNSNATVAYQDVGGVPTGHSTILDSEHLKTRILDSLKSYIYDPWVYEGFPRLLFMVVALFYLLRDCRKRDSILLSTLIILPYVVFFIPISNPSIRTILTIFPLLAIASGRLIDRMISSGKYTVPVVVILAGLFLQSAFSVVPLFSVHTGFRDAADLLKEQGVRQVLTPNIHMQVDPYMDIYGVNTVVLKEPGRIKDYRDIPYMVIAMRESFFDPLKDDKHLQFAREIISKCKPIIHNQHVPSQHAMDRYRRESSYIANLLLKLFLGRDYRRCPIEIYLYRTEELIDAR